MNQRSALQNFRRRMQEPGLLTALSCSIPHPGILELACRSGHDFVIIDAEHSSIGAVEMEQLIRAADVHHTPCLVKLKLVDEVLIRDALDAGACGVIAPHIKSAADLERLTAYCRFPPRGVRGLCSVARANAYASSDVRDLVSFTNEDLMIVPIIEDAEALENLDEILEVDPSILVYEIGPVDLALSLGLDLDQSITDPSPRLQEAIAEIVTALHARGKKVLYPTRFPNVTRDASSVTAQLRQLGADLVYGLDVHTLNFGSRRLASLGDKPGAATQK